MRVYVKLVEHIFCLKRTHFVITVTRIKYMRLIMYQDIAIGDTARKCQLSQTI